MDVVSLGLAKANTRQVGDAISGQVMRALLRRTQTEADTLHPTPPTLSVGLLSASTMTNPITHRWSSGKWRTVGAAGIVADSNGAIDNHVTGAVTSYEVAQWGPAYEALNTDVAEVHFIVGGTSAYLQVEVDGQLLTLLPVAYTGLTAFTNYVLKIQFAAIGNHQIRVLGSRWRIGGIRVPRTGTIVPLDDSRPKMAVIGASFSASAENGWPLHLSRFLGTELFQCAVPGSGVLNDASAGLTYGAAARLAPLSEIAAQADFAIVEFSGNDAEGYTQQQIHDATLAYLNTLAGIFGRKPIIAFSMPPRGANVSAADYVARHLRATEQACAETTANVIGYYDTIGTVDPLPAYTAAAGYSAGARVTYLGGIYVARVAVSNAPAALNTRDWRLVGIHTGTGNSGTPVGDGTRDAWVGPDNLHPTADLVVGGYIALAKLYLRLVRNAVRRNARTTTPQLAI